MLIVVFSLIPVNVRLLGSCNGQKFSSRAYDELSDGLCMRSSSIQLQGHCQSMPILITCVPSVSFFRQKLPAEFLAYLLERGNLEPTTAGEKVLIVASCR